jgi:hypothetical protein
VAKEPLNAVGQKICTIERLVVRSPGEICPFELAST